MVILLTIIFFFDSSFKQLFNNVEEITQKKYDDIDLLVKHK